LFIRGILFPFRGLSCLSSESGRSESLAVARLFFLMGLWEAGSSFPLSLVELESFLGVPRIQIWGAFLDTLMLPGLQILCIFFSFFLDKDFVFRSLSISFNGLSATLAMPPGRCTDCLRGYHSLGSTFLEIHGFGFAPLFSSAWRTR